METEIQSETYTLTETAERLHISVESLLQDIAAGKLSPLSETGRDVAEQWTFDRDTVDAFAIERETSILQNSTEPIEFMCAEEKDIKDIVWLCQELYGRNDTANYAQRLERFHANPSIYYVVKQAGIVVGQLAHLSLTRKAIVDIMYFADESYSESISKLNREMITRDSILPFREGLNEHVFIAMGVKQGLAQSVQYAYRIFTDYIKLLHEYVRQGIVIENLYATSKTPDGIRACRRFRFVEAYVPSVETHRFFLDLLRAGTIESMKYREIVQAYHPELIPKQMHTVEVHF